MAVLFSNGEAGFTSNTSSKGTANSGDIKAPRQDISPKPPDETYLRLTDSAAAENVVVSGNVMTVGAADNSNTGIEYYPGNRISPGDFAGLGGGSDISIDEDAINKMIDTRLLETKAIDTSKIVDGTISVGGFDPNALGDLKLDVMGEEVSLTRFIEEQKSRQAEEDRLKEIDTNRKRELEIYHAGKLVQYYNTVYLDDGNYADRPYGRIVSLEFTEMGVVSKFIIDISIDPRVADTEKHKTVSTGEVNVYTNDWEFDQLVEEKQQEEEELRTARESDERLIAQRLINAAEKAEHADTERKLQQEELDEAKYQIGTLSSRVEALLSEIQAQRDQGATDKEIIKAKSTALVPMKKMRKRDMVAMLLEAARQGGWEAAALVGDLTGAGGIVRIVKRVWDRRADPSVGEEI